MANFDFLKKALPWIGSAATAFAAGGPAGLLTIVAKGIGEIVGKNVAPTSDAIAAAVSGATPDQLIEMKKLDQAYALQMQQLGFQNEQELEQIGAADRASARNREIQVRDSTPKIISAIVILAAGVGETYCAWAVFHGRSFDAQGAIIIGRILGMLDTSVGMVLAYYLGSSAGSARKTDVLNEIAAQKQP
jgi:hypothetical protein